MAQLWPQVRQAVIGLLQSVYSLYPRSGGGIAVRQSGGTNEVQISRDTLGGVVDFPGGWLLFNGTNSGVFRIGDSAGVGTYQYHTVVRPTGQYSWAASANAATAPDTGLTRAAAKVVGITDGSTGSGTLRSVPVTPAQITSNQNDYAPTPGAMFYRLSTDAARNITGLVAGVDGQVCEFWNVGLQTIVLKHEDAGSAAANRFYCVGSVDITFNPNGMVRLTYDGTIQGWRVGKLS
jgi:hypothetical protein